MAKCLVVGGAGFIGSNLADELVKQKNKVTILDNLVTGKKENLNPKAKFVKADIRDLKKIRPHFQGVDFVFLLAALSRIQPSIEDPITHHDVNVNGALNVLVAAKDAKVKKLVYSTSFSVYGNQKKMPLHEGSPVAPLSPYGLHKYVGEQYCRLFSLVYGLPTVCLRYSNAFGPRMLTEGAYASVLGIFIRQRLNDEPMTVIGDGRNKRDYVFVGDIVRANILAAGSKLGDGRPVNIGYGYEYSVKEIAKTIGGPVINLPPRFEVRRSLADISLAKKMLKWAPKTNVIEWLKEYKKQMGLDEKGNQIEGF